MHDTMRQNAVIRSLMVFGTMTTFSSPSKTKPTQTEDFEALRLARSEMETITTEHRFKLTHRSKLPPPTYYVIYLENKLECRWQPKSHEMVHMKSQECHENYMSHNWC